MKFIEGEINLIIKDPPILKFQHFWQKISLLVLFSAPIPISLPFFWHWPQFMQLGKPLQRVNVDDAAQQHIRPRSLFFTILQICTKKLKDRLRDHALLVTMRYHATYPLTFFTYLY